MGSTNKNLNTPVPERNDIGSIFKYGDIFTKLSFVILGVGDIANSELLQMMQEDPSVMALATTALVFQVLEICAVPVFSFQLVEGAVHTASYGKYVLRVLGLAVVCQILYGLTFGGMNPVFALVMSMVMLYFFRRYPGKKAAHIAIKTFAVVGTFLWSNMLGIENGAACVILTAAQWALRDKTYFRTFGSCLAAVLCSILSPLYMASPIAFLVIYLYREDKGSGNKLVNYAGYPVILLICWLLMGSIR